MTIQAGEWNRIRDEWRERTCATLDDVIERSWPAVAGVVVDTFQIDEESKPRPEAAQHIIRALGAPPSAPLLTVVHVYAHALRHWQVSMDDWPGGVLLEVCAGLAPHVNSQEAAVFSAFREYVVWLQAGYRAENGLNCSCPTRTRSTAEEVRGSAATFKAHLDSTPVSDPDVAQIVEILKLDVEANLAYFGAVARVAATVQGLTDGRLNNSQLGDAIDDVASKLAALDGDSHQSNLRPHLAMLEALKGSQARKLLGIESARLRYCYPFAMLIGPEDAPDLVKISQDSLELAAARGSWKASWKRRPQRLSDLWGDRRDALIYTIELPTVRVTTTSGDSLEYSCEIRLREGGNHNLILTHQLRPPPEPQSPGRAQALRSLHLLNQAFRRATSLMGIESVGFVGEIKNHGKIPQLVKHVLQLIAECFDGKHSAGAFSGTCW